MAKRIRPFHVTTPQADDSVALFLSETLKLHGSGERGRGAPHDSASAHSRSPLTRAQP